MSEREGEKGLSKALLLLFLTMRWFKKLGSVCFL